MGNEEKVYDEGYARAEEKAEAIKDKNTEMQKYIFEPIYSDFSHQQILTATILLEDSPSDQKYGYVVEAAVLIKPTITEYLAILDTDSGSEFVGEYRRNLAGWLGDIWLADHKMSDDDYKADLDGVNISGLVINEDISTIEAVNEYYELISNGTTTREREFLYNKGEGDVEQGLRNVKGASGIYQIFGMVMDLPDWVGNWFIDEESDKKILGVDAAETFFNKLEAGANK